MAQYLQRLTDQSGVAFVVGSMLAMGPGQRPGDIIAPLKDPRP